MRPAQLAGLRCTGLCGAQLGRGVSGARLATGCVSRVCSVEVDNNDTIKICDLVKNLEAIEEVRPKFDKESIPNAAIREGVGELKRREGEEALQRFFINTAKVEADIREPPLVDEDWHAGCQAIYKGVGRSEWQSLCCNASSWRRTRKSMPGAQCVGSRMP